MPKCDFNQETLTWVFSYKFAAYFQNSFLQEHLWKAAFVVKIEEKDEFHVIG